MRNLKLETEFQMNSTRNYETLYKKKKISFKSANREIYGSKSKKTKNPVGKKQPIINILREGPVAKKRKRD